MRAIRTTERSEPRAEFTIRRMTAYDTERLTEFAAAPGMRCLCYGSDMYGHRCAPRADEAGRVLALLAVLPDGTIIGEAGYVTGVGRPEKAELTVAVQAPYLHRGVVTRLLRELVSEAKAGGVRRLAARAVRNTAEPFDEFAAAGLRTVQLLTVGGMTEMTFELE